MGLHHLHMNGILHRDLKPHNILVRPNGHLVIADFGLAAVFDDDCRPQPHNIGPSSDGVLSPDNFRYKHSPWAGRTVNKLCGTPQYMAPEVWERQRYGFSADWWSMGVILFRMMTNKVCSSNPKHFVMLTQHPPSYHSIRKISSLSVVKFFGRLCRTILPGKWMAT